MKNPMFVVHPSSYVDEGALVGEDSKIWHFSHIMSGAVLGQRVTVGQNVFVADGVHVGDDCKIQNNVSLYKGVTLGQGVFCGPSCVFTNVNTPRSSIERKDEYLPTHVEDYVTIGANATIICGHSLGSYSFIAAGAVVTGDVKSFALMAGVPAKQIGWVSHSGERLSDDLICPRTGQVYQCNEESDLILSHECIS